MRIFDAHCHLQDNRIYRIAPKLIRKATEVGVQRFTINGIFEVPKCISFFLSSPFGFFQSFVIGDPYRSRFRVIGI